MYIYMYVYVYIHVCIYMHIYPVTEAICLGTGDNLPSAQEWRNRTLDAHEQSIAIFSVLAGSRSSCTEITVYIYFSLL